MLYNYYVNCRYEQYVEQAYVEYLKEQNRPDEVYICMYSVGTYSLHCDNSCYSYCLHVLRCRELIQRQLSRCTLRRESGKSAFNSLKSRSKMTPFTCIYTRVLSWLIRAPAITVSCSCLRVQLYWRSMWHSTLLISSSQMLLSRPYNSSPNTALHLTHRYIHTQVHATHNHTDFIFHWEHCIHPHDYHVCIRGCSTRSV